MNWHEIIKRGIRREFGSRGRTVVGDHEDDDEPKMCPYHGPLDSRGRCLECWIEREGQYYEM